MGADLDVAELHLSIKSYATQKPYVDVSGITSFDMPYEALEGTDVMFEAKVGEISTAKVTLPSLIAFPGLRPLFQNIKEGDRVELYNFQPDCGDPILAGNITPNGIEEQDGKVVLNVEDTLGQLRWQHVRRSEYLSGPVSSFYQRAMGVWKDLINEDFLGTNPQGDYLVTTTNAPTVLWSSGSVSVTGSGNLSGCFATIQNPTTAGKTFPVQSGDAYLMEADLAYATAFVTAQSFVEASLALQALGQGGFGASIGRVGAHLRYQPSSLAAYPEGRACDAEVYPSGGPNFDPGIGQFTNNLPSWPRPLSHHFAVYMSFGPTSVTIYAFVDNINIAVTTQPFNYTFGQYAATLNAQGSLSSDSVTVTSWRVSKLVPALIPAARFNPQTSDALTYQPNNEDNLQLLQLFAEKDNAEYRPLYHAWPQIDELELDGAGTLGKYASRVLGYEQPPSLPTEGSPQVSPLPVVIDVASFLTAPPLRLEEGYNLESPPRILPKANAHANDVIRMGSSTADAQVAGEKWSATELGRPQHSPSGAVYPRFEQITNDDRMGIQSIVVSLAGFELARRTDPTPSLELQVVDEVPWAFRWRAGDQVLVKTQSLRTNLEQEMRVQRIQYKAGAPVRTVTVGKTDFDPTMLRMLSEDTKISWLYDQSGSNPGIYAYPFLGNINNGASSAIFTIPLDQYTTGTALIYAALHWFADANVMNLQPIVNGNGIPLAGFAGASNTDSGLIVCTGRFQRLGTYQLSFKNNDASPRNLTAAFLVLRIKG